MQRLPRTLLYEPCPIPANEQALPTVMAEHVLDVPMDDVRPGNNILEGLCFDREGRLYLCCTPMGRLYRADVDTGRIELFLQLPDGMMPSAIKIHKDGRLFVTCVTSEAGCLVAVVTPEGVVEDRLLQGFQGRGIDDMVFDREGGLYFTDLYGTLADPSAGVYYLASDLQTVEAVVPSGMIASNGIALSPDERTLWVTEYGRGLLHRIDLAPGTHRPQLTTTPYHFTGCTGPDSCCVDAEGNLYVSMCDQGRFLVFNPQGFPVGQILVPGRERGRMLKSTHVAIRPGTADAYLCTADLQTGESAVFRAGALAKAHLSYQFQ